MFLATGNIEKVPRDIQGEKSRKDKASFRKLISTIGASPKRGGTRRASLTFNGAAGAPLVGIFILGSFFTSANWIGALTGGVLGFAVSMWGSIGHYIVVSMEHYKLPVTTLGCNATNLTTSEILGQANATVVEEKESLEGLDLFYGLSNLWFSAIGVLVTVIGGIIVSFFTGCNKMKVDDSLQLKIFENIFSCMCQMPGLIQAEEKERKLQEYLDSVPSYEEYIKTRRESLLSEEAKIIAQFNMGETKEYSSDKADYDSRNTNHEDSAEIAHIYPDLNDTK